MTPITIEPNSGLKMAGVKIKKGYFNNNQFEKIIFVGKNKFFCVDNNGTEAAFFIDDVWFPFEESVSEEGIFLYGSTVEVSDDGRNWFLATFIGAYERDLKFCVNIEVHYYGGNRYETANFKFCRKPSYLKESKV